MKELDFDEEFVEEQEGIDIDEEELLDDDELDSRSAAFIRGYKASF